MTRRRFLQVLETTQGAGNPSKGFVYLLVAFGKPGWEFQVTVFNVFITEHVFLLLIGDRSRHEECCYEQENRMTLVTTTHQL